MLRGLVTLYVSGTMNSAAPEGTPPRRLGDKKNSLLHVPRRGPEAGDFEIHGSVEFLLL